MNAKQELPSMASRRGVLRYAFFVAVMLGVAIPIAVGAQGWWWGSPISPGFDSELRFWRRGFKRWSLDPRRYPRR
jgi:hypothetical protein